MSWFRHLTIGQKLFVSFGFLLLLLGASLAAILYYLAQINSYVERHDRITIPAMVTAIDIRQRIYDMTLLLKSLEEPSKHDRTKAREQLTRLESEIRSALDVYRTNHAAKTHPVLFRMLTQHGKISLAEQEFQTLDETARLLELFGTRWRAITAGIQVAGPEVAAADATARQLLATIYRIVDLHAQITAEMKAEGDSLLRRGTMIILGLIILLGVMIVVFYVAARSEVAAPLRRLADTANRVAHHDLSAKFDSWNARDEVGDLSRSLVTMLDNLRDRTRALERKSRELEAFTYSVAHDLKGPLREIEGFSSLIQQKFSDDLQPTARHYLSRIGASALRMTDLINDLLRYSRLEQQSLPMSSVNIRSLLDQILHDRLSPSEQSCARIRIDLPYMHVQGDPPAIQQALTNLIDNAVKFSRHANPAEISISGTVSGGERIICIRDNGIGFDPKKAERIFGLFERLHSTEEYPGTGIGLAIVRLVMEKHGGRVWAESEPGKGSCFYLAFREHSASGSMT